MNSRERVLRAFHIKDGKTGQAADPVRSLQVTD